MAGGAGADVAAPDEARRAMPSRRWLLALGAIVVAAVGLRLAFTAAVDPHVHCAPDPTIDRALAARHVPAKERCLSDALAYHLLGDELAHGDGYIRPFDSAILHLSRPTAEYPPLYPAVLAGVERLGVHGIDAQQLLLGALLGGTSTLLIGLLGRSVGGDAVGLVAAGLAAVHPALLGADALLMTESLFLVLVSAALLATVALHDAADRGAPGYGRAVLVGALLGLAALCRADALAWIPLVALAVATLVTGSGRQRGWRAVAVVVAAVVVLAPWTIRNVARFHTPIAVSNNLGTVVDGANCQLTYYGPLLGSWRSTFVPGAPHRGTECFEGFAIEDPHFDEAKAASTARRDGLHYARRHAGRVPLVAAARLARTFGVWPHPSQQVDLAVLEGRDRHAEWLATVLEWVLLPLAAGGVWLRRHDRRVLLLLVAPVAVALTTIVTYGNPRFRAGAEPAIIVFAAIAIVALIARVRHTTAPGAGRAGEVAQAVR
jgi:4-amino-4-deoxy-L-arabinose transferase-like glycosyltransferase